MFHLALPSSFPPDALNHDTAAVPSPTTTPMDGAPPDEEDGRPLAMDGQAAAALAASGLAALPEGLDAPAEGLSAPAEAMSTALFL